jgi:nitrogen fixation negative regulator NifL
LDAQGEIIRSNRAFNKLEQDMTQSSARVEFLTALNKNFGISIKNSVRDEFRDKEISFDIGGATEPRWFSCSGTWLREQKVSVDSFFDGEKQDLLLLVAKEITDLKAEQERVKMNALRAVIAEEELVQGIRETIAAATYQMQGPLNLICAAHNMLQRKDKKTLNLRAISSALQQAMTAGGDAITTLQQCMPPEHIESISLLNINEVIREVLSLSTNRLLSAGVIVDWEPLMVMPGIYGREHRIRSMIKHLIGNAIDAMTSKGWKKRELKIKTGHSTDNFIEIIIEDSGPGIPEEERFKVFEPFYSGSKSKSSKSGLGLTMVQEVITEHRGMITISDAEIGGCRIEVQLPLVEREI